MLVALQIMNFWLGNAYGDADTAFGGTREQPYMGLGQGSRGSNPGFTLTAAPMIGAYKRKKFHAEMKSAWSGLLMTLAAIMYVDDMDMLLRVKNNQTTEEFFEFIQSAIDFWGMLVIASGVSLKQKKCQVAIASFKFSDGRPRFQQLKSLPEHQFEIPQKNGTTAPIPTKSAEEKVTALGFENNLKNSGQHQVQSIKRKGSKWASTINSNPYLRRGDVRLSLSTQLHPRLKLSIACLSSDPKKLNDEVYRFFYQTMSRMGVNKKLCKELRQMSKKHGGLGYFDLNIDNLGARFVFISRHWDLPSPQVLRHCYL